MRVLVFGDSIAQGFWDPDGGWVSHLRTYYDQQKLQGTDADPPNIFNLGVSGDSSDDVLDRVNSEAKARAIEDLAFVFAIGINDSRTKAGKDYSDTDRYSKNLSEILKIARKYSDKILFVGLTPCVEERTNPVAWGNTCYDNKRIREFDNTLRGFCIQNQLSFVDIFEPFNDKQNTTELLQDGLHPNSIGHQLISNLVLAKLKSILMNKYVY